MTNFLNSRKPIYLVLLFLIYTSSVSAQSKLKKIDDSGNRPNWVNWSRGKEFKSLGKGRFNKLKLDRDDEVYMFVAYAQEVANNGKTDLFSLSDAKRMASLEASLAIADIFKSEIDDVLKVDATMNDDDRERIITRTSKMTTTAKFSGYTKAGSYWEKLYDKESNKTYWDVYVLYSINKKTLEENLSKAMKQLDIPDKTDQVLAAIVSAADEAADEDIGSF